MKLDPKKILEKKFENVINGYNPRKVDQFLDQVIEDYIEMQNTIDELKTKIKELENIELKNTKKE